jgi:hypothetical protein
MLSRGCRTCRPACPNHLKHAALGDAVRPANLGSGRPVYVFSDQAIDRLSLQPPASRSAQTGPHDKRYVSLCRPYLCGSKGALGCPGTRMQARRSPVSSINSIIKLVHGKLLIITESGANPSISRSQLVSDSVSASPRA